MTKIYAYKTNKETELYASKKVSDTTYCKCGHGVLIPYPLTKVICNWCKNYVFKTKEEETEYRKNEFKKKLLEAMKGE